MRRIILGIFAVIGLCGIAGAEDVKARSYPLPAHGTFELKVPVSWTESIRQLPNGLPPTITFAPGTGSPFQVLVSPLYSPRSDPEFSSLDAIKEVVKRSAEEASQQSIEHALEIKTIANGANSGFYFTATDRAPKPGEFKFLAQGVIRVGSLRVTFTVLTNDGQSEVVKAALAMIAASEQR